MSAENFNSLFKGYLRLICPKFVFKNKKTKSNIQTMKN